MAEIRMFFNAVSEPCHQLQSQSQLTPILSQPPLILLILRHDSLAPTRTKTLYTWFESRWSQIQWAISAKNAMPANKLKATALSLFCKTLKIWKEQWSATEYAGYALMHEKTAVATSNLSYAVSDSLLTPIPNFIQIGQKTQKVKIVSVGRFWLVGLVGRKMVVGISNSFYVVFAPLLAPIPNFI